MLWVFSPRLRCCLMSALTFDTLNSCLLLKVLKRSWESVYLHQGNATIFIQLKCPSTSCTLGVMLLQLVSSLAHALPQHHCIDCCSEGDHGSLWSDGPGLCGLNVSSCSDHSNMLKWLNTVNCIMSANCLCSFSIQSQHSSLQLMQLHWNILHSGFHHTISFFVHSVQHIYFLV